MNSPLAFETDFTNTKRTQRVQSSPRFNFNNRTITNHNPVLSDKLMMRTNSKMNPRRIYISHLFNKSLLTNTQRVKSTSPLVASSKVVTRTKTNIKKNRAP